MASTTGDASSDVRRVSADVPRRTPQLSPSHSPSHRVAPHLNASHRLPPSGACVDAYRHCLAHVHCLGVYVNETAHRATLKTFLPVDDEIGAERANGALLVLSEADWLTGLMSDGQVARHERQDAARRLQPM
jgi:hypothetical protein